MEEIENEMVLMQSVVDTIDNANEQRMKLCELKVSLEEANAQVKDSAKLTRTGIKLQFAKLKDTLLKALEEREEELLSQVDEIEKSAMGPLLQCKEVIQQGIDTAVDVFKQGQIFLVEDATNNKEKIQEFRSKSNNTRLHSLPEVPPLCDVVCLYADIPEDMADHLSEVIRDHARVIPRSPVQITEVAERPGSLFVKWTEIEEETALDLCEFHLQYCSGTVKGQDSSSHVFQDAYKGTSTSCALRHLRPLTSYSLRVCGRAEGLEIWTPWSVPHIAMTTLPHYQWQCKCEGYDISNENKIAAKTSLVPYHVLYSKDRMYRCGHSIVFKVLESDDPSPTDGIGLSLMNDDSTTLIRPGALCVTTEGLVYIDGQEKLTRLPVLARGSVLTFDTEVLPNGKLRVNVEVDEKIVTFDWQVDFTNIKAKQPTESDGETVNQNFKLYFAMQFTSEDWKVGVE